jgi:hypothetical protein
VIRVGRRTGTPPPRHTEEIARLCGHSGTAVTEQVYRHPEPATAMDDIFERKARGA